MRRGGGRGKHHTPPFPGHATRPPAYPGVPDGQSEAQHVLVHLLEQDGLGPLPPLEHEEELEYDGGGGSVGVQLAGARHQHGPGHASKVPQRVGVDTTPWGGGGGGGGNDHKEDVSTVAHTT